MNRAWFPWIRRTARPTLFSTLVAAVWSVVLPALSTGLTGLPGARGVWAAEPAALPTKSGLLLWLAANQIADKQDGRSLAEWPDLSENGRHCRQANAKDQPRLVQVGEDWVVRFDGDNDHLRHTATPATASALTLFVVVAPHDNSGDFRGFLASGQTDGRDYETGFNIDMGPMLTTRFDQLNIEGRGFGGARDLFDASARFGEVQRLECVVDPARRQVSCVVNGRDAGVRPFEPSTLSLAHFTLGARFYTNGPGKQQVRGGFHGDLAEVIVFDRVLSDDERLAVRGYLAKKFERLSEELPRQLKLPSDSVALVKAENPPLVQMLVPGFRVRELPVTLPNVNNVRFRDDGKLVTLGYNGDLHLLTDTDGDGLEDRADLFWKNTGSLRGPIGLQLTPPGYPRGRGAFLPSKGKVSLIVDQNGDDRADQEIVVASGWQEIPQNVDAVGMAMGADGSLYFGLGTANYANAYLVDEQGQSAYRLDSPRGTVQRVSPDFATRETVCTGIRFPIAFAFNGHGDLFCTEQEGATWLPNGNPFDELLHIQSGRHYGFPPRHPRHNPDVIDEPSTFDFAPQHQSTCGMVFNEAAAGGQPFGPAWWSGDALICGESRGKIWRTRLVKSETGYVAASQLVAALQMLTVDACVAPDGDLVVACHSGPPDWGTGPTGEGKLFRIEMTSGEVARPVVAWAQSPQEVRIAFDRPLQPGQLKQLLAAARIEYGDYVGAGDAFETLFPPYAVVRRQSVAPRFALPVHGAAVTSDLRTLILNTGRMSAPVSYSITLPWERRDDSATTPLLAQQPRLDLDYSPHGLFVEWRAVSAAAATPAAAATAPPAASWSGWLPHPDLAVARALTAESADHQALWTLMEEPGQLTLRTRLDGRDMLRPKVQPGATIDYEWPAEQVTFFAKASVPLSVQVGDAPVGEPANVVQTQLGAGAAKIVDVTLTLACVGEVPQLSVGFFTNEDARPRPLPLRRFLAPWASEAETVDLPAESGSRPLAQLEGGNWGRGRRIFQGETAGCAKCHAVTGGGPTIGPDLANLVHRDYDSALRDILNPSFAINPDYITQQIVLNDGRVFTGVVQSDGDLLRVGSEKGEQTSFPAAAVESMSPVGTSVMPRELMDKLTDEQRRDLLTYLLTPPPRMPLDTPLTAPPLRSPAEVAAVLAAAPGSSAAAAAAPRPLNLVLVSGPKDHGPGEHDYPAWQVQWAQLLAAADHVEVSLAWLFPSDEQLAAADVLIFFQKGAWNDERAAKLDAFQQRGGGAVYIHWAVNGDQAAAEFSRRIGLASRGGAIRFRHGPLTLEMHNPTHPILRNLTTLQLYDESYWLLTGHPGDVTLLASSIEDGAPQPQLWTYERGQGRVFVSIPGHYSWTFDDPLFRIVLLRGIAWTAREDVDRFNALVTLGARLTR